MLSQFDTINLNKVFFKLSYNLIKFSFSSEEFNKHVCILMLVVDRLWYSIEVNKALILIDMLV